MCGAVATIVVTGLAGSRSLVERFGDEAAGAIRGRHLARLRAAVAEHDGRPVRQTADGLVAAFGSAVAAIRCAAAMQRASSAAGELDLVVGVDAGEPYVEPGTGDLSGTPVLIAERLCEMAGAGEIVVTEAVAHLARPRLAEPLHPLGALRLRGFAERIPAARVGWRDEPGGTPAAPARRARTITTVIADDQQLVRAGFRVILDAEPDISVVGEAADGRAAVDIVRRTRPDVVLMDISMPELDGLHAAERILGEPDGRTAVLMLTTFDRNEFVYRALRVGASGFLLKDAPADRLLDAVRVAAGGDALLAPSVTRRLIEQFTRVAPREPGAPSQGLEELTEREIDVLRAVARGLSNAEIAREFVLGENTIKTHVAHVLRKLGLRDRVQAVVLAYESGLVAREGEGGPPVHPRG